jgi:hypothetical protein
MHYPDLATCDYFGPEGATQLRAVGWLDDTHAFSRGPVAPEVLDALQRFAARAWSPFQFRGWHDCELCPAGKRGMEGGHANLFVPGEAFLYVAPELLVHYVRDHVYAPPQEFVEAVRTCPDLDSGAYVAAVRAAGPRAIGDRSLAHWTELGEVDGDLEAAVLNATPEQRRAGARIACGVASQKVGLDHPAIRRGIEAIGSKDESVEDGVWDVAGEVGRQDRRAAYDIANVVAWAVKEDSLPRLCKTVAVARSVCGESWSLVRPAVMAALVGDAG